MVESQWPLFKFLNDKNFTWTQDKCYSSGFVIFLTLIQICKVENKYLVTYISWDLPQMKRWLLLVVSKKIFFHLSLVGLQNLLWFWVIKVFMQVHIRCRRTRGHIWLYNIHLNTYLTCFHWDVFICSIYLWDYARLNYTLYPTSTWFEMYPNKTKHLLQNKGNTSRKIEFLTQINQI